MAELARQRNLPAIDFLRRLSGYAPHTPHLKRRVAFAGLHPLKSALDVAIVSARPIRSARARRADRISTQRYHNRVRLSGPGDIDGELIGWLAAAYALAG